MAKINRHIEIVSSTIRGLSSMGGPSREGARATLAKRYTSVGITIVNDLADLQALVALRPDVVFLGMKFILSDPELGLRDPNKIWLSEYLDSHGIAHTGSGSAAYELEFNKELAKQRVLDAGLDTARYYVARKGRRLTPNDIALTYPVFIKPTNRGGGLGIDNASIAHNFNQLQSKVISLAVKYNADALIEEYLPGREFSVAILKDIRSSNHWVMPIELIAPVNQHGERFLSAQIKTADTERNLAVTDLRLRAKLNELAMGVFQALGACDYGRIDIRLDASGEPHFLEANLLPSLKESDGNYFPRACLLNIGLPFAAMVSSIVDLAIARDTTFEDDLLSDDDVRLLPYGVALEAV